MARYIERKDFLTRCAEVWEYSGITIKAIEGIVDECVTADVVPKSEYEQLQKKYELAVAEREANVRGFTDAIKTIKADVAREIFAEIEKLSYRFMNDKHYIFGDMVFDIAELKKKYTGEQNVLL